MLSHLDKNQRKRYKPSVHEVIWQKGEDCLCKDVGCIGCEHVVKTDAMVQLMREVHNLTQHILSATETTSV